MIHSAVQSTLLKDAPNSGLTRYSGRSSMNALISLCYKKLPINGLSTFWTTDTSDNVDPKKVPVRYRPNTAKVKSQLVQSSAFMHAQIYSELVLA